MLTVIPVQGKTEQSTVRSVSMESVYLPSAAVMQSCGIPDANTSPALGPTVTSEAGLSPASVLQQGKSSGGTIHLMLVSSVPVTLISGLTTVFPYVGFTWQDFDGLKDSFRGGFCGKTPEAASMSATASFT